MKTMKNKTLLALLSGTSLIALLMGCELAVDFDRTKIPQAAIDAAPALDVVQPPAPDAAALDSGKTDAAPDASDASTEDGGGADAEADAS
jgi:hypothetical protein